MNDTISSTIARYEQDGDFTHVAPTQEMIESAQKQLGSAIPQQYIDYLNSYSHGGIGGVEILGVGLNSNMVFLEATLRYRKHGLPQNLLVVENCDEWLYCLDCDTGAVVSWSQADGTRSEYPSFDEFLLQEFNDAIENL